MDGYDEVVYLDLEAYGQGHEDGYQDGWDAALAWAGVKDDSR